jgi:integrase
MLYGVFAALPEPHTGRVWHQRRIRTAFENAVEAAKLDDFRVSMAPVITSRMRGCGLQALKELLGHADIKTTLIYAHLSPAHLRSEVARTARRTEPASISAQGSAQEVAELEGASSK